MSKTIEELAKQYAKYQTDEQGYGSMEEWKQDVAIYYDDAKEVLSWLFGKPLASRLTAEEKERVRKIYEGELEFASFYQRKANSCINQQCRMDYEASRDIAKSRANMLESIFGADFFKEGE